MSFLSICTTVKDNRIFPTGYLRLNERLQIAKALGAGEDLAREAGGGRRRERRCLRARRLR
jgi:hypothetical protein